MAKEKKERTVIPPCIEYNRDRCIVYAAVNPLNKGEAFAIVWPVPQITDGLEQANAEAKTRFDVDLQYLVTLGVRSLATRPDYQESGFEFTDEKDAQGKVTKHTPTALRSDGHAQMQGLADNYRVGRVAQAGEGVKVKAKRADSLDAIAKEQGFASAEAMLQAAREMGLINK